MDTPLRLLFGAVLTLVAALSGCTSGTAPDEAVTPATNSSSNPVVIDVRTPEEFAEAHLTGAVNIDINGPGFADGIAQLDKDTAYQVYCRSGNRSAQAVALMRQAGFLEVSDIGGLQDAAETTGLAVVSED
ncbi:Rhodanese-related sulfurtransferase [Micrococcales bacterium KH10]|nr:Rhodanese-related sulfurtransferase [Micrococcales bacterium KH10]